MKNVGYLAKHSAHEVGFGDILEQSDARRMIRACNEAAQTQ
jgi:hypothetical protein